jgi:hypothetical protein
MSGLGLRSPAFVGILTASATVPSAPVLSGAFAYSEDGASYFDLSWTTPANGGSPITGYTIRTAFGDNAVGLINSYQDSIATYSTLDFYVFATNAIGNSPLSNVYTAVG